MNNVNVIKMFIINWYQLSQNQIINLTWLDYIPTDLRWKLLNNLDRPGTIARMFIAACNTLHCNDEIHFSRSGLAVSHSRYKRCTTTQRRRNTLRYIKKMIHHIAICKVHALTPTKASAILHVHEKFTSSLCMLSILEFTTTF